MKQQLFRGALFGALIVAAVSACKRGDDTPPDTKATRIIGSWRESYRAIDSNRNGQPDSTERFNTTYFRLITFYTNGIVRDTVYMNGIASATDATYTITGDYLNIIFPGIPVSRIQQLDANVLILSDTSAQPPLITVFNKQ